MVDPLRAPRVGLRNVRLPLGLRGTAETLNYISRCAVTDAKELQTRPDLSTVQAFEQAHITGKPIDLLLRPFLSGVLADPELATSRRFADLVLRSLARGTPALPAQGMRAIPEQLARPLRGHIFRGCCARSPSRPSGWRPTPGRSTARRWWWPRILRPRQSWCRRSR
ncbi:MAG: hypothetical protein U0R28_11285 [Candidatus Nanopelagicales bacterium]